MRAPSVLAYLLATAALVMVKPAEASESYPEVVADALTMPCNPPCTICHATSIGGPKTVITAFGKKAMELGQTGGLQDALLRTTLTKMTGIDSDADGVNDTDELTLGLDPNVAGGDVCSGPKYGCGASVAAVPAKRGSDPAAAVAAFLTVLAGALMMRRR
ncbi:MAG TPA: hypothetical protein VEX18_12610 [Polyangiaceae bacterium]|nr:hypothetical protein [Polyangiaceae bacterium]